MSSSSDVYDDTVESFDKLNLSDSLNGATTSLTNLKNSTDDNDAIYQEEYSSDYYSMIGHHKLGSRSQGTDDFESKLQIIGSFLTIEQFWNLYSWLKRPHELENLTEIHIFKNGIKPMWEHPINKNGGKFVLKFKKGVVARLWENLLLAVLGEQFAAGDQISGVVLSIRHHFDSLCIWNINSKNRFVINQIRETLKKVLNLNDNFRIEYKVFYQSQQPTPPTS